MVNVVVEISIEDEAWKSLKFDPKKIVKTACLTTLEHLKIFPKTKTKSNSANEKTCEISVLLTNDEHIKKLNKQYRDKNQVTNVLSFPMIENVKKELKNNEFIVLGDIVLSFETLERESKLQKKEFKNHLTHLIIHSMLHLLGYKHSNNTEAEIMETEEIKILKKLGIKNPYN
jgi:probable rRNA maturation factor